MTFLSLPNMLWFRRVGVNPTNNRRQREKVPYPLTHDIQRPGPSPVAKERIMSKERNCLGLASREPLEGLLATIRDGFSAIADIVQRPSALDFRRSTR
jgi:hypothetical protein